MPQACRKRVTSAPQARRSRDTVLDHDAAAAGVSEKNGSKKTKKTKVGDRMIRRPPCLRVWFCFFWLLTRVWAAPFKTLVSNQKTKQSKKTRGNQAKPTQGSPGGSRGQPVDHRTGCSLSCVPFLLASLLENPHTNTHRGARGKAGGSQLTTELAVPCSPPGSPVCNCVRVL